MTQWSEAESGVTVEATQAGQDGGQSDASSGSAPCRRCVTPKVELPALNRSDQRVPVYWDQIVPVWQSSETCRRKPAPSGSDCRSNPGTSELVHGSGSSRRTSCSGNNANKVSFDDIMSMYQSSKPSTAAMV